MNHREKEQRIEAFFKSLTEEDQNLLIRYIGGDESLLKTMTIQAAKRVNEMLVEIGLREPPIEQSDEDRIEVYRAQGLEVSIPKGRSLLSDELMLAEYDGVPYCVDGHSSYSDDNGRTITVTTDESARRQTLARELIIRRHHSLVKDIYEYCSNLGQGEVWAMVSTEVPMGVYFGNHDGYLCHLSTSFMDAPDRTPAQMAKLQSRRYELRPNWEHQNHLFEGLKHPGLKVRLREKTQFSNPSYRTSLWEPSPE